MVRVFPKDRACKRRVIDGKEWIMATGYRFRSAIIPNVGKDEKKVRGDWFSMAEENR